MPLDQLHKEKFLHYAVTCMESIWFHRNQIRLGEDALTLDQLSDRIMLKSEEYWRGRSTGNQFSGSRKQIERWIPPKLGVMKFNFDAAFSNMEAFGAVVLRNSECVILNAWIDQVVASDAYMAEAQALVCAFQIAEDMKLDKVDFEGDALGVILAVRGSKEHETWQAKHVIDQARHLFRNGRGKLWQLNYVPKQCNKAAHNTVQWGKSFGIFGKIEGHHLPLEVWCDYEGTPPSFCNSVTTADNDND